jgi:hypothetical protein
MKCKDDAAKSHQASASYLSEKEKGGHAMVLQIANSAFSSPNSAQQPLEIF